MLAVIAKVTVKIDLVPRFLQYLEADAEGSLGEPGCLRFDILRDDKAPEVFWIYEVYRDQAAYAVHQKAPYFQAFFAEAGDTLAGPPEIFTTNTVFPKREAAWAKR
jgi:autoinducer 2-degrading protein